MKWFIVFVLTALLASCTRAPTSAPATLEVAMSLTLTSTVFASGQSIPSVYSCLGRSVSPPLAWSGAPGGAKSFALIMDDPDAPSGTFVHWVIYNIPQASAGFPEAVPGNPKLADGTLQGTNGAGRIGYTGPCPPSGTHRYFFKLYALDAAMDLPSGAGKDQLLTAMQGHILAQGELMGTFSK